ncbi:uncharacterized protein ASCRUDRAFT_128417 [Ascoidea rubescens DSM 1968]|uniref:Uncharacterized protein n=1 Tax=Ascoidea rubescens DSM 1968 TaxID=1344418 RepID=A0A1D2V9K4_9ASCO|nr:hypothetical protein ASCRUDRAFT_128417 [Ascoidea rubescens DSM 1968]ODV58177.1 hypothetical protein ASCRUDRAFT_128417 [Ascoidea rubescens DSM 1968]
MNLYFNLLKHKVCYSEQKRMILLSSKNISISFYKGCEITFGDVKIIEYCFRKLKKLRKYKKFYCLS